MEINGKRVVDSKAVVTLEISPKDVKDGATKDPTCCAAALACMRQLHAKAAKVHIGRVYVELADKWLRFQTPKALRSEIVAFDRGGTFEPGEYVLRPLPPSDRASGRRQGAPDKPRKGPKTKRAKPHYITGIRGTMRGSESY